MVTASGLKANAKIFSLLTVLTAIFIAGGHILGGQLGMVVGLLFAGVMNIGSYWYSDKIVLKMYDAEKVDPEESPELHEMVERLSENAGIPKPELYKNSMSVPNAFATGRSPEKGVVCLTEGLIAHLDKEEIEGVVAHELAHIKNRDSLINAAVATVAGAIAVIAEMAFWSSMFSGNRDNGELLSAAAFMVLIPVISLVIRTAVSRTMEYRADSEAVRIHGQREGLASALQKISRANKQGQATRRKQHVSKVKETGSNLFIENPFSSDSMTRFFSTHPPTEKRIQNIQDTDL